MKQIIEKVTEGVVRQTFIDGRCIKQVFQASDIVYFVDQDGNVITHPQDDLYCPFNMKQPNEIDDDAVC